MPARSTPIGPGIAFLLSFALLPAGGMAQDDEDGPRYTSRDVLPIHFDSEDVGSAGVERNELWVSVDGGDWSLADTSEEVEGDFMYAVRYEGRYRFQIRTVDRVGHRYTDPAELEAVVDRTPPALEILRPTSGTELTAGHRAVVYWEASDANLGPNPVRVAFRESSSDSWVDLPDGPFPASGRAVLELPGYELPTAEVLVEVADRANNSSRASKVFQIRLAPERPAEVAPPSQQTDALRQAYDNCNRGRTFFKLQQYERSEEAYTRALELVPNLAVAHHDIGVVHYTRQRYDKAVQHFRSALSSEPSSAEYRFSLAVAYFRLERHDDALDHLEQALAQAADYDLRAEILWTMGIVHERMGRLEAARGDWRRILAMKGNARIGDARERLGESEDR